MRKLSYTRERDRLCRLASACNSPCARRILPFWGRLVGGAYGALLQERRAALRHRFGGLLARFIVWLPIRALLSTRHVESFAEHD